MYKAAGVRRGQGVNATAAGTVRQQQRLQHSYNARDSGKTQGAALVTKPAALTAQLQTQPALPAAARAKHNSECDSKRLAGRRRHVDINIAQPCRRQRVAQLLDAAALGHELGEGARLVELGVEEGHQHRRLEQAQQLCVVGGGSGQGPVQLLHW